MQSGNGRSPSPPKDVKRPDGTKQPAPSRFRMPGWVLWVLLASIAAWYVYFFFWPQQDTRVTVPYSSVIAASQQGLVKSVTIEGQSMDGEFTQELRWTGQELLTPDQQVPPGVKAEDVKKDTQFDSTIPENSQEQLLPILTANHVQIDVKKQSQSILPSLLFSVLPFALFIGLIVLMGRNMSRGQQNVFGFGRSKAKVYDPERPRITFADMAGEEEAKKELSEVVDFLKNPTKYHQIGARLPRGILLVGPPGTGKTLLARAVAGEAACRSSPSAAPSSSRCSSASVPRACATCSSRPRPPRRHRLHRRARRVGGQRFAGAGRLQRRARADPQPAAGRDGRLRGASATSIVVAATNRPDVLDPALLRPGRFDRQVTVGLPDRRGREAILQIHSRGIPLDGASTCSQSPRGTPGFSGADLANLVNEAALTAARYNRKVVTRPDFDEALDKIVLGTIRATLMNEHDRRVVAYHEAGHAIAAHFSPGADPLRKVSIVPRGRALGVTIQTPSEDRYNYPRHYLLARLNVMMGGRAAEMLVFDEITTGAQNDLKEVVRAGAPHGRAVGHERRDRPRLPRHRRAARLPRP